MQGSLSQTFNDHFQPLNSPVANKPIFLSALEQDQIFEYSPNAQPNIISKGTLNTIAGGILTLYDKTGGTKILTYDPKTGVVTILGSLVAQQVNTGTYTSITLAGMGTQLGTMVGGVYGTALYQGGTLANAVINNPTIGTPALSGGTLNPAVYQIGGTVGATGTAIYVKTVNFAGSTVTNGTVITNNGIVLSIN